MDRTDCIKNLYGLVGYPISHSFSQQYFRQKFINESIKGADFLNFELEDINLLRKILIDNTLLRGFSVTIPYKERIIPFLDELDADAATIGAVNSVTCHKTGNTFFLKGYNTDYYGFKESLKPFLSGHEKFALILGNGGASKAVKFALSQLDIEIIVVSRQVSNENEIIQYKALNKSIIQSADIIVNTTPLGTWPNIDNSPEIPYHFINKNTIAFDLVYNPAKTKFLTKCEAFGAIIVNGMEMLKLQAEKSWEYFNKQ